MPLTNTAIRNAKSGKKTCKLYDERGLYLEVSPNGGKWWRLKYRFGGKEKRLSLGVYPDVTLKMAREAYDALTFTRTRLLSLQRCTWAQPMHVASPTTSTPSHKNAGAQRLSL